MDQFTQLVLVVGRVMPDSVQMLGTGFLVSHDGKIATSRHVTGGRDDNLVILAPHIRQINEYQDLADTRCQVIPSRIVESDPMRDLAILRADLQLDGFNAPIASLDDIQVGEQIGIFGFPHSPQGRRCLTFQQAEIGAKVKLDANGIKSKHAVLNVQARPGQSGSLVFSPRLQAICGVLMGAWIPKSEGGISLGGIDPQELHQTTHCISAEYLSDMM